MDKLRWYVVDKNYVKFLKQYDNKIEDIDYNTKLKPYIGIIIKINKFNYYVPLSSAKEKHYKIKENMDFVKIIQNDKILCVLNLNNMIPILDENISVLKYSEIEHYRKFTSENEKNLYIAFLNKELKLINNRLDKIRKSAVKLYKEKSNNPKSRISRRCCNFKLLEEKSKLYKTNIH